MANDGKRKTRTSTEVKARYNKKTYESVLVNVPKELAQKFKQKCKDENVSQASIVKKAIQDFLDA